MGETGVWQGSPMGKPEGWAAAADVSFVLACDLPWVSSDTLRQILVAMHPACLVVLPLDGQNKIQYLHGLWRLSSLDLLERAFTSGERSIAGGLKHFETSTIATCQVSRPHTLTDLDEPPPRLAVSHLPAAEPTPEEADLDEPPPRPTVNHSTTP